MAKRLVGGTREWAALTEICEGVDVDLEVVLELVRGVVGEVFGLVAPPPPAAPPFPEVVAGAGLVMGRAELEAPPPVSMGLGFVFVLAWTCEVG
jgi:hypothetical protein